MHNSLIIQESVPLSNKNWFGVGGPATFYCQPRNAEEFQEALAFGQKNSLAIALLGEGANSLISDAGFDGLVIRPQLNSITITPDSENTVLVEAGAGVSLGVLIRHCLDNAIIGLEEFSGIPGTIGGSVYINVHYFEFLLSQFLVSAVVIEKATGKTMTVETSWFAFGYDQSKLIDESYYLVSATFKLKKVSSEEAAYARGRHDEMIRYRERRYPSKGTCGSFFRNFHQEEVIHARSEKKLIYVAYYLDKLGIKGELSVGGACVSYQHANMLVANSTATAQDIITLARTMQEMVQKEFGIIPQPECRFIGFTEYPLL
jgi:UDP-N-acetylmuramate dehydrogenase